MVAGSQLRNFFTSTRSPDLNESFAGGFGLAAAAGWVVGLAAAGAGVAGLRAAVWANAAAPAESTARAAITMRAETAVFTDIRDPSDSAVREIVWPACPHTLSRATRTIQLPAGRPAPGPVILATIWPTS